MKGMYSPTEESIARSTLEIDPEGLAAKKLARIGVDIAKEQEAAKKVLERSEHEQPVQDR